MKRISVALLVSVFCFLYAGAQQKIMGFSDERAADQLTWEKKFDAEIKENTQDEWMRFITSKPHHLGSPQGKINANYIADLFRSWGYETAIETYYVLFPTPKKRVLALLGAKPYKAKLEELTLREDRTSGQKSEQLPTYNAYSADGNVTAPLVFVNRGLPDDYEELRKMGVDVKGKIVIAKYGGSWRGLKPKFAAENGAIGCLIYSDPLDDGYSVGDVYPEGPFRPGSGVQRGSVMDWPVQPADPLTPFIGATQSAKRIDRKDAITLM
ncbi:MAG: PA domain-containing protein, partial [Flavitalea sp.]